MTIAVIGSEISGNGTAQALSGRHEVTVYEHYNRPVGHSATIDIEYDGRGLPSTPASADG